MLLGQVSAITVTKISSTFHLSKLVSVSSDFNIWMVIQLTQLKTYFYFRCRHNVLDRHLWSQDQISQFIMNDLFCKRSKIFTRLKYYFSQDQQDLVIKVENGKLISRSKVFRLSILLNSTLRSPLLERIQTDVVTYTDMDSVCNKI